MTWTTLLDPEVTRAFVDSEQLHGAWFVPKDWPGKGPSVVMEIPECILHASFPQPSGVPVALERMYSCDTRARNNLS